jgi:hypothetical protein
LSDIKEPREGIRQFLLWPKQLEHFSFSDADTSINHFSTTDFRYLLAPHRRHLQLLKLESLYSRDRACIDVTDFPELQSITIPFHDVDCSPEEAASKLLGPRVSHFGWSWILNGHIQPGVWAFGEVQADWLARFVQAARSKKSALRFIHIHYQPDFWARRYSVDILRQNSEYPFDRIDALATMLAQQDIKLTYDEPSLTRSHFQEELKEALASTLE